MARAGAGCCPKTPIQNTPSTTWTSGPLLQSIVIIEGEAGERRRYYAPDHIASVLRKLGMQWREEEEEEEMYSESQFRRIRLLERFLLKMERRYYVSEEDLERFPFVRERNWESTNC